MLFNKNVIDPDVEIHNSRSYEIILKEDKIFDYFIKRPQLKIELIFYSQWFSPDVFSLEFV
jgi:hypothetical protein